MREFIYKCNWAFYSTQAVCGNGQLESANIDASEFMDAGQNSHMGMRITF